MTQTKSSSVEPRDGKRLSGLSYWRRTAKACRTLEGREERP